ncbi:MAG: multiheme c-type cytochrome [Candidatus Acidiferrum sp.]
MQYRWTNERSLQLGPDLDMPPFKDLAHLLRLAAVFLAGLVIFIAVRAAIIPKSFGEYGPYRGAALKTAMSRPIHYAGHEACEGCHPDVLEIKSKGVHAHVNCESCHGALAAHADDPTALKPVLPDVAKLCIRCHTQNIAKPGGFPQVDAKEHSGGQPCNTCHLPHSPALGSGGKK